VEGDKALVVLVLLGELGEVPEAVVLVEANAPDGRPPGRSS
jgi:hypothetical protein